MTIPSAELKILHACRWAVGLSESGRVTNVLGKKIPIWRSSLPFCLSACPSVSELVIALTQLDNFL
jgi:hypothetical protein